MKKVLTIALSLLLVLAFAGCAAAPTETADVPAETAETPAETSEAPAETGEEPAETGTSGEIKIGVSFVSLQEERFVRERDIMETYVAEKYPDAEMLFQGADYDPNKQYTQCENLIAQGIDVLVVTPKDKAIGASIAEMAKAENIPVIAYDEAIDDTDLDAFVTFSLFETGKLMAQYAVDNVPTGNYYIMEGDQTHFNAQECSRGKFEVLQPLIDSGDITIVGQQWCANWDPEVALSNMENALTDAEANGITIDAVVCSNDGMATGVIQALDQVGLAGTVIVTGQDAELSACQRIVEGTQSMTVYKEIVNLAQSAIDTAVALATGQEFESNNVYNNGFKDVPAINPAMFAVDKNNIDDTVIADGWLAKEDVYANVQ